MSFDLTAGLQHILQARRQGGGALGAYARPSPPKKISKM